MSTNFLAPKSKIMISGPVKEYSSPVASGNIVTRYFCNNCGSAIAHGSSMIPDLQALQTGNFPDFAKVKIEHELYVKDRWTGLGPIPGAVQVDAMPNLDFIQRAKDLEKAE
ncbi:hypothetical protein D9756_006786 [Leucocoprinus leucothites]|uniref:CENP-V/GFA domain-containing protein n=1 Tax=Leucocoprinus leucothites TaxID=201217 RepID=A0A8H5LH13_9AGAR|nr:hypothetical protein D9756_006786 [Leucoagaricus leucothites]